MDITLKPKQDRLNPALHKFAYVAKDDEGTVYAAVKPRAFYEYLIMAPPLVSNRDDLRVFIGAPESVEEVEVIGVQYLHGIVQIDIAGEKGLRRLRFPRHADGPAPSMTYQSRTRALENLL
jgi:hypothetical protein